MKAIDFCLLILYLRVLLKSLMSLNSLLDASLGTQRCMLRFSINDDSFVLSFSTFILISFSGVITLSSTILSINSGRKFWGFAVGF